MGEPITRHHQFPGRLRDRIAEARAVGDGLHLHPLVAIASLAIAVAALRLGRAFLIPIVGAIVLSVVLAPLINWLVRRGFPNVLAVLTVVLSVLLLLAGLGLFVAIQARWLGRNLPAYRQNMERILSSVEGLARGLSKIWESLGEIRNAAADSSSVQSPAPAPEQAMKVEGVEKGPDFLALAGGAANAAVTIATGFTEESPAGTPRRGSRTRRMEEPSRGVQAGLVGIARAGLDPEPTSKRRLAVLDSKGKGKKFRLSRFSLFSLLRRIDPATLGPPGK